MSVDPKMSGGDGTGGERPGEFEQHASEVLHESAARVSSRVRSRLNQARHAAVEEIAAQPRWGWRGGPALMPVTGAAAAVAVIAVMLIVQQGREGALPVMESSHAALEDLELLTDKEGLDLIEGWDGSFYEWAAAQAEAGEGGTSG